MKNIEKLKEEQQELKERLQRLIDFLNSEEYFRIPEGEKALLNQQRAGMEMYLNALTNRLYSNVGNTGFASSLMLPFLFSMMNTTAPNFPPITDSESKSIIYTPGGKEGTE